MNKIITLIFLCIFISSCATSNSVYRSISHINQNSFFYIDKNDDRYVLIQKRQKELASIYLKHWFSPWNDKFFVNKFDEIKEKELELQDEFIKYPGFDENMQFHNQVWIENIVRNANLEAFPNLNIKAIVVKEGYIRALPTVIPSFGDLDKAGEGFPFDRIQYSFVATNTPILVLHVSRDGAWYLILTPNTCGWFPSTNVAVVDNNFINKWQAGKYVVAINDTIPIFDDEFKFLLKTRIGTLYPYEKITHSYNKIFVAISDKRQNAIIKKGNLRKEYSKNFPIKINPENIASITNKMIGNTYGWGDLYEYRDCSSTMMNLFANFGIWLPRNSSKQAELGGNFISFDGLSNREKGKFIIKNAIPFLTLIHSQGHIMLYIGHINNQVYIFHNMWGIKTKNIIGQEGRAVIGKTVITPLNFDTKYINSSSLLNKIDGMAILDI